MDSKDHSTPQSGEPKTTPPVYFDSKNISSNRPTSGSTTTITKKDEKKVKKPPVDFKTAFKNTAKSVGGNIAKFFKFIGRNVKRFFVFAFSGKNKRIAIPVTAVIVVVPVTLIILANTIWKNPSEIVSINPADNIENYQLTGWRKENLEILEKVYAKIEEGQTNSLEEAVKILDDAISASADNQPKQFGLIMDKVGLYNSAAEDPETALSILKSIDVNSLDEDQKFSVVSAYIVIYDALGEESIAQRYRDKLYVVGGLTEDSAWYDILKEQGDLPPDMNAELTGNEDEENKIDEQ